MFEILAVASGYSSTYALMKKKKANQGGESNQKKFIKAI